jgi:hypothetical protein
LPVVVRQAELHEDAQLVIIEGEAHAPAREQVSGQRRAYKKQRAREGARVSVAECDANFRISAAPLRRRYLVLLNDDFFAAVVAAVRAHHVRAVGLVALRAGEPPGGAQEVVRAAKTRTRVGLTFLWNCHDTVSDRRDLKSERAS